MTPQPLSLENTGGAVKSRYSIVSLILIAGMLFSLLLVGLFPEGTFFTGDSSIKFLLTRQIADGVFATDLRLEADHLTKSLWRDGFYPYAPPFVYALGDKYYINIPIFFSALTALPYRLMGWHGLYVVPTLSLWSVWFLFVRAARRLSIDENSIAVGLFGLIFASPLTIYGSLYWEHTVGVALAFCGLSILLTTAQKGYWVTLAAGALLGSSVWFRSEMYVLNALVLCLAGCASFLGWRLVAFVPLAIGGAAALAVLLAFNQFAYGIITGLHALQIIEPMEISRAENAARVLMSLVRLLFGFFPLMLPIIGIVLLVLRKFKTETSVDKALVNKAVLLILALFPIGVAFVAPTVADGAGGDGGLQWGPRFLLILIPLSCLLLAVNWRQASEWPMPLRRWAQGCVAVALLAGFVLNSGIAPWRVAKRMAPLPPIVERLRADPAEVVIFADWWGPQALVGLTKGKKVFLAMEPAGLARLSSSLLENGVDRFLYVSFQPKSFDLPLQNGNLKVVAGVGFPLAISEATLRK